MGSLAGRADLDRLALLQERIGVHGLAERAAIHNGKDDAEPYRVGFFRFEPTAGLWCLAQGSGSELDLFAGLLENSALGGERSSGYGGFSFTVTDGVPPELQTVADSNRPLTHSGGWHSPQHSHRPGVGDRSCRCHLPADRRSGFVASATYADSRRCASATLPEVRRWVTFCAPIRRSRRRRGQRCRSPCPLYAKPPFLPLPECSMTTYLRQFDLTFTCVGPVFIGSGQKYSSKEYAVVEGKSRWAYFPDMEKLYALVVSRGLAASFEQFVLNTGGQGQRGTCLGDWLTRNGIKKHLDPTAAMRSRSACSRRASPQRGRDGSVPAMNDIHEFIKDGSGNPYVPAAASGACCAVSCCSINSTELSPGALTHVLMSAPRWRGYDEPTGPGPSRTTQSTTSCRPFASRTHRLFRSQASRSSRKLIARPREQTPACPLSRGAQASNRVHGPRRGGHQC